MRRVRPIVEKETEKRPIFYQTGTPDYSKIYGILLFIVNTFITLSLLSYNANDTCLNVVSDEKIRNVGGRLGATIADILLQFFGLSAFVLVVVVFIWAVILSVRSKISFLWLRIPLLVVAMLGIGVVLSCFTSYRFMLQMLPGGYVGNYLYYLLIDNVGILMTVIGSLFVFLGAFYFSAALNIRSTARLKIITQKILDTLLKVKRVSLFILNVITLKFIYDALKNRHKTFLFLKEFLFAKDKSRLVEERRPNPAKPLTSKPRYDNSVKPESSDDILKQIENSVDSYVPPSLNLLKKIEVSNMARSGAADMEKSVKTLTMKTLTEVLNVFGVKGKIINYTVGPVVTLYELQPQPGTKASRVIGLAVDIARSMQVASARISTIVGKDIISIELPNTHRQTVPLRQLLESAAYASNMSNIPIILGKDIMGEPIIADLTKMPHLLIAGTTGSGKSIGMNTMILSILYKLSPEQCKLIMIDPKMLEFALYDGIPHLLKPVITDPKDAIVALKWVVKEMTDRYKCMSGVGVRNISSYNDKVAVAKVRCGQIVRQVETSYNCKTGEMMSEKVVIDAKFMPYIVVVIDEMADLMLVAGKEIEVLVQRLAQMARAAGIHVVMATQRPSVDVITGVIKANFPTRISYQVTSKIDSRTILGEQGAEQLLGQGDMLYMSLGGKIIRVHGGYVSDSEVEAVTSYLRSIGTPTYVDMVSELQDEEGGDEDPMEMEGSGDDESLYKQAQRIVLQEKKPSISYVQRRLRIGYNKAANLIEKMESEGLLTPPDHTGKRTIIPQRDE